MKKLLQATTQPPFRIAALRNILVLCALVALTFAFWSVTAPVAKAREMSPTEMLQSQMPQNKNISNASKPEVLSSVCSAVKKYRKEAAQIVRVAVAARKSFAGDIVSTAARCLKGNGIEGCDTIAEVVRAAIAEAPDASANILELAIIAAPNCRGAIERAADGRNGNGNDTGNFENAPSNVNPPPGAANGGGGGFNPEQGKCQVCHTDGKSGKRMTLTISCNAVPAHIRHGDTEGPCPVTQTTNP